MGIVLVSLPDNGGQIFCGEGCPPLFLNIVRMKTQHLIHTEFSAVDLNQLNNAAGLKLLDVCRKTHTPHKKSRPEAAFSVCRENQGANACSKVKATVAFFPVGKETLNESAFILNSFFHPMAWSTRTVT
jgi:hypothetical protein